MVNRFLLLISIMIFASCFKKAGDPTSPPSSIPDYSNYGVQQGTESNCIRDYLSEGYDEFINDPDITIIENSCNRITYRMDGYDMEITLENNPSNPCVLYFYVDGNLEDQMDMCEEGSGGNGVTPGEDSYEPDSIMSQANYLSSYSAMENHTLTIGDLDWFTFSPTSGYTYTIKTTGTTDTRIKLFDATGTVQIAASDNVGTDVNASITWTCQNYGQYYFVVYGYAVGPYTINLTSTYGYPKELK